MGRLPRPDLAGQAQHVIQRGNNREAIFCRESDYRCYLEKLAVAVERYGCDVHAYVLMTNHVHLLMTPVEKGAISKAMQSLGRQYVRYFNHIYRRTGTLWEGRFRSTVIDSEAYLLTCMRYIELNPVRAAMVAHPAEYPWSSYQGNALGAADTLLRPHQEYRALGRAGEDRRSAYRELFEHQIDSVTIETLREATNKAWVLGDDRFCADIERKLNRRVSPKPRGGDHRSEEFRRKQCFNRV